MILINFIPIRLAGRDDANDFAALPITVTDDEHSHGDAQSQEHKPLLERRTPESRAAVPGRLPREGEQASVGIGGNAGVANPPKIRNWRHTMVQSGQEATTTGGVGVADTVADCKRTYCIG